MTRHALLALLALVLALPAAAVAQEASLTDIEDEVMCPICGTTLELSDSPQAERERELIRGLIDEGKSKDEIKDALVAEYGEDVLATPDSDGFDLTAWLVPALVVLLVGIGIAFGVSRLRGRDDGPDGPAVAPEEDSRIDRDMAGYDL